MLNFFAKFLHRTVLNTPTSWCINDSNGWRYQTVQETSKKAIEDINRLHHHLTSLQNEYDRQLHINDLDRAAVQFLGKRLEKLEQKKEKCTINFDGNSYEIDKEFAKHLLAAVNVKSEKLSHHARNQKRVKGRFAK